ncbi:MAG: IclR family transcriptional regulator [Candidatus Methylomirabilis sp.]|nr:IclR family transcriptional regulator [Deltaproteobacteria bacterium]
MVKRDKSNYVIQSVSHALDVLEQFRGDVTELGVTELSKKLKLHKNNVFRLLATLEARGYVEQNRATENYRLGLKSLELGQTFIHQMGIIRQARPILEDMKAKCNETAYLGIMRDQDVVYVDVVETDHTVRVVSRIGARLPTYCTAVGKVQIAFKNEEEMRKHLPRDPRKFTAHTNTDPQKLIEELRRVAELGYAVDNEEYEEGVRCVGAPIRDYTRKVIGGVSVSGPSQRISNERIEKEIAPLVLEAARQISRRLGYEIAVGSGA